MLKVKTIDDSDHKAAVIDIRFTTLPPDIPPDDGYDPRDNRTPLTPIKTSMAYLNMLRSIIGTGLLGFPLAVAQAGIILGPIFTMSVGILVTYSHFMLILDWDSTRPVLLVLFIPFLIMEMLMTDLKVVTRISLAGNLLNAIALLIVIYLTSKDIHGTKNMKYYTDNALPLSFAFGNCLFNSSAVGVLLSMDRSLEDPKVLVKRYGVINIGILVPTMVGTVFGIFGYWSMGEMEENLLRYLPFDERLALFAIGVYMFSVAFVFPIQCYPGMLITLEVIKNMSSRTPPPLEKMPFLEKIFRPIFVIIPFTIAYVIPFQGPFVAFVGNLCTSLLALIFPALMDLSLHYPNVYGKYHWILIKDIVIIIIGLVSWTFGVYLSAKLIHKRVLSLVDDGAEYF